MPRTDLKNLPPEVKTLINDGVYSLYSVKNLSGVAYVLLTNTRRALALSADGDVLRDVEIERLSEVEIGDPAYFADVDPSPALKLNYA